MQIEEMHISLKFKKPINYYGNLCCDGITIKSKNRKYRIDYYCYVSKIDEEDNTILHIRATEPCFDIFPSIKRITPKVILETSEIVDLYIEPLDDNIEMEQPEIQYIIFRHFGKEYFILHSIIDKYNERIKNDL